MKKLYIEDKVLTAIMKQATLIVEGKELEELIKANTTNPRQADVEKKCEAIRIRTNEDGLVQVVGSGTNDFTIERITSEDAAPENLE